MPVWCSFWVSAENQAKSKIFKKAGEKLIKIVDSQKSCSGRFSRDFRWFLEGFEVVLEGFGRFLRVLGDFRGF